MGRNPIPVADRFWRYVDKRGPEECWPWLGVVYKKSGRGQIKKNRRTAKAYHVAWELENGQGFPQGLHARHSCDNPNCVNPSHIIPGTPAENVKDAFDRRRRGDPSKLLWPKRTHCRHGHEYTTDNTLIRDHRRCRVCERATSAKKRAKRNLKVAESVDG